MSDETLAAIVAVLEDTGLEDAPRADGAHRPPDAVAPAPAARSWGFAVQLYSLRSRGSWGHGDLRDLADLAAWSARELGAGFVLINPLHAAEPLPPVSPSPYLPMSRRWVSPLYLRIEDIPEYKDLSYSERKRLTLLSQPLRRASQTPGLIDRDAVWTAKREALEMLRKVPLPDERQASFDEFRAQARAGTGRLGRLVRARRGPRARLPDLAGAPARPAIGGTGGTARRPRRAGRVPHVGAVARRRAGRGRAGGGTVGGHEHRHHRRPGDRRAPRRRRRVGGPGVLRAGLHRRRPAGRVQPARPGLGPAARCTPARWRPTATGRSPTSSTPTCPSAAACASTMSWACPGCGGSPPAPRRPRARTCTTTLRARSARSRPPRPRPVPSWSARTSARSSRGCARRWRPGTSWAPRCSGSSAAGPASPSPPSGGAPTRW